MMRTPTPVEQLPRIGRAEAANLAATENRRMIELLGSIEPADWTKPTDCPAWDVRAMAAHVLGGMEAFATVPEFVHQMRAAPKAAGDGPFIDGMTAVQVRERADLTSDEIVQRATRAGTRSARARRRVPGLLRRVPMKQEVAGVEETWRMGYLLDVILTRDTWMHRVDITRATGRPMVLTPDHDGRIVADVVAEWARRHGQPFTLELDGPAGGTYAAGDADDRGEAIALEAVELCRILSGRTNGAGLLTTEVPF
jgi:uncharacterized protein (TIGR03083 family)